MGSFSYDIYRDLLLKMKRGTHNGRPINAKPLLMISIISLIEDVRLTENRVYFNQTLKEYYAKTAAELTKDKVTPLFKPYVFLGSESFYHINWKINRGLPHDSSDKFVRDNIEYVYLDNALWDLLQDPGNRRNYKEALINNYLKSNQ